MYQTFGETANPEQGPARLAALRIAMNQEHVAGFIVPRADAHQGEYVADHDARLAWLTGFTGSAGFCAALSDIAGVFIDGRYRTQVKSQIDLDHFTPVPWPDVTLLEWLKTHAPENAVIGFDPWLHTSGEIQALNKGLKESRISLRPLANLVDKIWHDQPAPPVGQIKPYPLDLAGESHADKRHRLAKSLQQKGLKSAVITLADSIAWLLNMRGSDIPRNPVPHCFALLHDNAHLTLFVDPAKCDTTLRAHLGDAITLRPLAAFGPALRSTIGPVQVDKDTAPHWVHLELQDAGVDHVWGIDPCILPKATKTTAEIDATTTAHLRDGVAMCEFLAWFDAQTAQPTHSLSEIDVVTALEGYRRATNALLDISFETIAGSGPNGAIMHYRVSESSNRTLQTGDLIVVDSGGQYIDGTTDITRTLPVGPVGITERTAFTRVLQGMIALSRVRWPEGLTGRDLDPIARYPLWLAGLDFNHGTGHGVGVYLCVHEGPQRISKISEIPLQPGMILSNEPGYYREGAFGIRIENLVVVQNAPHLPEADARKMLDFKTLTFVPIDRRLIISEMLSTDDRAWLDAYHATCLDTIGPRLSGSALQWLVSATAPL